MPTKRHAFPLIVATSIAASAMLASPAHAGLFGKGGLIRGSIGQVIHEGVERPVQQLAGTVHNEPAPPAPRPQMSPCRVANACDNPGL